LKKGDEGGFERIKSPLSPLFQRGEIDGINLPWPLFFKEGKLF